MDKWTHYSEKGKVSPNREEDLQPEIHFSEKGGNQSFDLITSD